MTKQIIHINGSLLRESACRLRTFLKGTIGYKELINSANIEYGQAFHKFAQSLATTNGDVQLSMLAAFNYFKNTEMIYSRTNQWMTLGHLSATCLDFYEKVWNKEERDFEIVKSYGGAPLVEQKFSIPYYSDDEVDVLIEGTIDMKVKVFNGCYAIGDYKTTAGWDKAKFFLPYRLSNQLMLYRWAVEWHAAKYPNSIYAEMVAKRLHCFVQGIFLTKDGGADFERSEYIYYSDDTMEEFRSLLDDKVEEIMNEVNNATKYPGYRPLKEGIINGACKTEWGTCPFLGACSSPDEKSFWGILDGQFKKEEYNPLAEK